MTDAGYRARLYVIEWHAELWRRYGTDRSTCERMLAHCCECLDADMYDVERPTTDDPQLIRMQAYFDRLFREGSNRLVCFD